MPVSVMDTEMPAGSLHMERLLRDVARVGIGDVQRPSYEMPLLLPDNDRASISLDLHLTAIPGDDRGSAETSGPCLRSQ